MAIFEECQNRSEDYDSHWVLNPICQECNRPLGDYPHNKYGEGAVDNHLFVAPEGELILGENAYRKNDCAGYLYETNTTCDCPCHWYDYYVNVYIIDRAYGGPEEGGWYYDCGTPITSIRCDTWKETIEYRDKMREKFPFTRKRYNYHGGDDYDVMIEKHFAEYWPQERPHYE